MGLGATAGNKEVVTPEGVKMVVEDMEKMEGPSEWRKRLEATGGGVIENTCKNR